MSIAFITRLIAGKRLVEVHARIRALEAELTAAQQRERRALASLGGRRWHPRNHEHRDRCAHTRAGGPLARRREVPRPGINRVPRQPMNDDRTRGIRHETDYGRQGPA